MMAPVTTVCTFCDIYTFNKYNPVSSKARHGYIMKKPISLNFSPKSTLVNCVSLLALIAVSRKVV